MRIGVIEPGREPYLTEIQAGGGGSYLAEYQRLVGGLIEYFEPLFGDNPALIVNEEFLSNGSAPNRAIYANERLHDMGYLDQMTYSHVPEVGELYGLIFGTFIAVSYDEAGNPRDMPADEWEKVKEAFCGRESIESAAREIVRILSDSE